MKQSWRFGWSCLVVLAVSCGEPEGSDAGAVDDAGAADAGASDAGGTDAGGSDAGGSDAGANDAGATDAGANDAGGSDAGGTDAGATDASLPDAGWDAALPDAGPFTLPASCTDSSECGPDATCETTGGHCVCNGSSLPCGGGCCPMTIARDLTIATSGHAPEIGADAAGNVYVLFERGYDRIRLATLPAGATTATDEAIATCSGEDDAADLAVAPDGTIYAAIHQPGSGRSGSFTLYSRAPGDTSFSSMTLRSGSPDAFAYDAAVGISRASNGDIYASVSARSGDGTMGLAMTRFDGALGVWMSAPTILTYHGHSRSELFARTDGYFVGVHDLGYAERYASFDAASTLLEYLPVVAGPVYDYGETAAAMTGAGLLYTFTGGRVELSDGSLVDLIPSSVLPGARSDVDMALDADDNPVFVFHDAARDQITMLVRMPHGGYTMTAWPVATFVPFPIDPAWVTLDAERLPSGNVAIVMGDSMDQGTMRYLEIAR